MQKSVKKRFLAWMIAFLMVFTYMPAAAYAEDTVNADSGTETAALEEQTVTYEELSVLDGKITIHNSAKTATITGGVVTITAPGSAVGTPSPNAITIYNETSGPATISFDYIASKYSAFNLSSSNGTYSEVVDAGSYMTLSITGNDDGSDAVLTLSNFDLKVVSDASEVKFEFDSSLGSVTAAGAAVASGDSRTIAYSDGLEVAAAAANGAEFLAWINKDTGRIYSREASTTLKPTEDATIKAVFINGNSKAHYLAGGKFLLDDFEAAMEKASKVSSKVVVLMNDTTLSTGTYTVPAGVTLLVPFDDENSLYTTAPKATHDAYVKPTAYRTLTLADGAKLVINGAMSVSAMHYAAGGSQRGGGAPTGDVAFVEMEKGSSITVNDDAALYVYGYVTGQGTVTAKSGATVYENFQLEDFRGGNATTNMATTYKEYGVLPVSQYYVQNIEVPMTLETGAAEYTYTSVFVSDGIYGAAVAFISEDNAMFNLTEGYVVKQYDGTKDRLIVEANGTVKLSPITVKLSEQSIDSGFFNLPINSNITVNINSGKVEIDQDIALLPGSEIIIAEGAVCTLSDGSNVYVYDSEQWGNYCGSGNKTFLPVLYAPGRTHTRTDADLTDASIVVNGTLDASDGFIYTTTNADYDIGFGNICSTKGGVIKTVIGYEDCTYQYVHNSNNGSFDEIKLLPANLKNADGSYAQSLDDGEVATYTYQNGFWACDHEVAKEVTDTAATCVTAGLKTVTCDYDHVYEVVLPATGKHDMIYTDEEPATCTEKGTASGGACKNCDYTEGAGEIAPLGHDYEWATTKPATCTEKGSKDGVCTRCGDKKTEEIELKAHTRKADNKKATCTESGITGKVICSVCNAVLESGTVIDPLGHSWDNGFVSIKPTVEAVGQKTFTCTTCGTLKTEDIPKLEERTVSDYDTFIELFTILEELAYEYTFTDKGIGKDPAMLVIKYMRTGVDRYNSGSWQIMAGYEDTGFADYVRDWEDAKNAKAESEEDKIYVTALKNLENMYLPNGDYVDLGHMFGTMDISYTNINSVNHADVSGWAGDTTDLLTTADSFGCTGELEELVAKIADEYLLKDLNKDDKFSSTDMLGDMDGFYFIDQLKDSGYEKGGLTDLMNNYFTETLSEEQRAKYFMENRLQCGSTRDAVREAVYNAYTSNTVIGTLEETRVFQSDEETLNVLRRACCYAVADYFCKLAGDYVEMTDNPYYTVDSAVYSTLAPGITQEVRLATNTDGYNLVYYIATADITRDDVDVYANYADRPIPKNEDGSYAWSKETVLTQANDLQAQYSDPDSDDYIENYQVVTGINADGFAMLTTGAPSGLHVMDGVEYRGCTSNGFFGILKDGTAVIGTQAEYNNIYRGQVAEGVGGFGSTLIKDGEINISADSDYYNNRTARTAVGITKTGKVVFLVLDGRQAASIGGSMAEIAQIMLEAGCVDAINLDGAGSTTYVAKPEGSDSLEVINEPSDGEQREVGNTLMMVSTAPSSTAFDHAVLDSVTSNMTVGSTLEMTAKGVSATGDSAELPEGTTWAVSNARATITDEGVVTAVRTGSFDVQLKHGDTIIGQKTISVVVPDRVTFTKSSVNAVYGSSVALPVKAYYQGKPVTVNPNDFTYTFGNAAAGTMDGFNFVAAKGTDIKNTKVTFTVKDSSVAGSITVFLYEQGQTTFDFDQATGGERTFAWLRQVTNSSTEDDQTYYIVEENKDMTTSYAFAIDMTQIPIPEKLQGLVHMLPGHDQPGACAWTFLCNLAQRMSDLTEVKATVVFDENVDVDYSDVTVVNDYFKLNKVDFDEETNTLVLTLNWIRQKSAIDVEMANPICIVNGLKVTPKEDADWDSKNTLTFVTTGNISYKAYMKANSLYTFACDKTNQATYDLEPYINDYIMDDGDQDKGGSFGATYAQFSDSYTLVNALRDGWVTEDGGFAYYVKGEKKYGIQNIQVSATESYYYDFGETGIIPGKDSKYTGFVTNSDGTYSYSRDGVLISGWVRIGDDYYYFNGDTKKNLVGKHKITVTAPTHYILDAGTSNERAFEITNTVEFEFDETGKVSSTFHTDADGNTYYYYGPGLYCRKWMDIDGKTYHFGYKGEMYKGLKYYRTLKTDPKVYYIFDQETGELIQKCEGFVEYNGYKYYFVPESDLLNNTYSEDEIYNGRLTGLQEIDGKYYMFSDKGSMRFGKRDISAYVTDGCKTAVFDKTHGYAVDENNEPMTDFNHNIVVDEAVASTCSLTGLTEGAHCSVCGEILVAQEIVKKKSHTSVTDKAVKATCTKAGKTEGSHCKLCGTVIKAQQTVAKKKHNAVKDKAVKATCTKAGKTEGSHCSVCKKVLKAQTTVKAKGHKWEKSYTVDKKATAKATGSKSKHCATCDVIKSGSKVTIAKIKKTTANTLVYNGKKRTTNVTVVNSKGTKLVKGRDFTVTYKNAKGTKVVTPKNVGTYKAVVMFKGQYSGTATKTFKINPQGTNLKLSKNGKKQFTVKWSKKTAQVTGYQIMYSTKSNMKNANTATVTKAKTTTKTIKKLRAKQKYYVQIRTYKTVNGTKYYSAWSDIKSIKTK